MPPLPFITSISRRKPRVRSSPCKPGDVAFEQRLHRGVDRRGDAALELPALGEERVAHGDRRVRPDLGGDRRGAALVSGIGVGVQEMDDERLAARGEQRRDGGAGGRLVERGQHPAAGVHPLGNLEPEVARDDRREAAGHAVGLRTGAAAELEHVAEARGGDEPGPREPALEHGVGGGGGAVDDQVDPGESAPRRLRARRARRRPGSPGSSASCRGGRCRLRRRTAPGR